MKKMRAIAVIMAAVMAVPTMPASLVYAEEADVSIEGADVSLEEVAAPGVDEFKPTEQGYTLKWDEEFNDSFDSEEFRSKWVVETHEKGWVNDEWQEYIDESKVLEINDGVLKIKPVKETVEVEVPADEANNLYPEGKTISVTVNAENMGKDPWDIQKQETVAVESGKKYKVKFTASSTVARTIVAGVQQTTNPWGQYGQKTFDITTEDKEYSYEFVASATDANAGCYFNLGKNGETPESDIVIKNITMVEVIGGDGEYTNLYPADVTISEEITSENMGSNPWEKQVAKNVALTSGKTYKVTFTASSTVARTIVAGTQKMSGDYDQYGQKTFEITTEPTVYSYQFDMAVDDSEAGCYFNLGKSISTEEAPVETPESTVTITDISLIDVNEEISSSTGDGGTVTKTVDKYYSGRISTQNKETFTYGYFECKAKVPSGQGYLPAFWLMANDENLYGQWPQCGEIDAMEIWGSKTDEVLGTIHYGKPHQENQGKKKLDEGVADFSQDFHTFGVEWVPGRITWYVDGVKFHEAQNWYSKNENDTVPLSYPAPFDQDFYIILNLAIGNSWAGRPDETTSYEDNNFEIDYVKVYQKDVDDSDIDEPEVPFEPKHEADADGNYVINGNFAESEVLTDNETTGDQWVYKTALEGVGTAAIDTENKQIDVTITAPGTADYSIQLLQADLPFEKGAEYEVSFKAWADQARTMNVDIKAPDHGYQKYMQTFNPELTTTPTTFTTSFKMTDASDDNGRIEFNMGAAQTGAIHITDVVVKKTKAADPNEKTVKTVTSDGNYIYNGSFSQGKGGTLEWTVTPDDKEKVKVTAATDGRRLEIAKGTQATITQEDLAFAEGTQYLYSMEVDADAAVNVDVTIGGVTNTIKATKGKNTYSFILPSTTEYADQNVSVSLKAPANFAVKIDNLRLEEDMLLKNGSFTAGLSSYNPYVDGSASATYVVDSLKNDNALAFTINNTGDADWKIQLKQENIPLEQGKAYRLKFKAKTDLEGGRKIRVIMQGGESLGWPVYSGDDKGTYTIGAEYTEFVNEFRMTKATDAAAFLSVCMGAVGGTQITSKHDVVLDDFSLEEIDLPVYEVTFDGNGQEMNEAPVTQYVDKGTCAEEPASVTSTDSEATFLGWYADEEGTVAFDFNAPITSDTRVYAKWDISDAGKDASIKIDFVADAEYTGKAIKPAIRVTQYGKELVLNKDYKVTYKNNVKVNKDGLTVIDNGIVKNEETGEVSYNYNKDLPTITVTGISDFSDVISFNFNITKFNIGVGDGAIETADVIAANDKKDTAVSFKVKANGKYLTNKTEYTAVLKAKNAKDADGEDITEGTEFANCKITKGCTGVFELTVSGAGNYGGTITREITVDASKTSICNAAVTFTKLDTTGEVITADALKAVTTVKLAGKKLTSDDFNVAFVDSDVVNAGSYQVRVTGKGNYAGTKLATVKLTAIDIKKAKITIDGNKTFDRTNGGKNGLTVKMGENTLEEDRDYVVSVINDVNAGTAKLTVSGIGKYAGAVTKTYKINAFKLANDAEGLTYSKSLGNVEYIAKGVTPDVNISYKGARLVNGVDYTLIYAKNAALGTAKVTVKGKGNFTGSITDITFNIVQGDIKKAGTVITVNDVVYNAKPGKYMSVPKLTTATGKALAVNTDYSKTYKYELVKADGSKVTLDAKSAPEAGSTIRVTVYGGKNYSGFITADYRVADKSISGANIKIADKEYTGKAIKITAEDITNSTYGTGKSKTDITLGTDYEIVSYTNNVKAGTAKVTIKGRGDFGGTKTISFKIKKKGFIKFLGIQLPTI